LPFEIPFRGRPAEKLRYRRIVSYKETLIAQMIQLDMATRLLLANAIIKEDEFFNKLKRVWVEYERRKAVES